MSPPESSRQELIAASQGLVKSLAWKIHRSLPRQIELEDLVSYGQVGLAEAARDFDATRTGSFSTYAYYRIRGAIYDGLSKMSWFGRGHYARLRYAQRAGELLAADNDAAGGGKQNLEDDVHWLRGLVSGLAVAYLASASSDDEGAPELVVADSAPLPPGEAMDREAGRILHELIAELPEQSAELIRATYFEGLTLQEAGQRLGISKAWASRLHARTLEQLGRSLRRLELVD